MFLSNVEDSSNNGRSTSTIIIKELDGNECSQISTVKSMRVWKIAFNFQFSVANSDFDSNYYNGIMSYTTLFDNVLINF